MKKNSYENSVIKLLVEISEYLKNGNIDLNKLFSYKKQLNQITFKSWKLKENKPILNKAIFLSNFLYNNYFINQNDRGY